MAPSREEQESEYAALAARVESPASGTTSIDGTLGMSESGPASMDFNSGLQASIAVSSICTDPLDTVVEQPSTLRLQSTSMDASTGSADVDRNFTPTADKYMTLSRNLAEEQLKYAHSEAKGIDPSLRVPPAKSNELLRSVSGVGGKNSKYQYILSALEFTRAPFAETTELIVRYNTGDSDILEIQNTVDRAMDILANPTSHQRHQREDSQVVTSAETSQTMGSIIVGSTEQSPPSVASTEWQATSNSIAVPDPESLVEGTSEEVQHANDTSPEVTNVSGIEPPRLLNEQGNLHIPMRLMPRRMNFQQTDGTWDHEVIYSAIESTSSGVVDTSSIYRTPTVARVPRDGSSQPNDLSGSRSVAPANGLFQRNEPSPTSGILTSRQRPTQQQRDAERSDSSPSTPDNYIPRLLAGTSFRRRPTEAALPQTDGLSDDFLAVPRSMIGPRCPTSINVPSSPRLHDPPYVPFNIEYTGFPLPVWFTTPVTTPVQNAQLDTSPVVFGVVDNPVWARHIDMVQRRNEFLRLQFGQMPTPITDLRSSVPSTNADVRGEPVRVREAPRRPNMLATNVRSGLPRGINGLPNRETNRLPNGEINGVPNGETNRVPNGETNRVPNGETNRVLNGETNRVPNQLHRWNTGFSNGSHHARNHLPNGLCRATNGVRHRLPRALNDPEFEEYVSQMPEHYQEMVRAVYQRPPSSSSSEYSEGSEDEHSIDIFMFTAKIEYFNEPFEEDLLSGLEGQLPRLSTEPDSTHIESVDRWQGQYEQFRGSLQAPGALSTQSANWAQIDDWFGVHTRALGLSSSEKGSSMDSTKGIVEPSSSPSAASTSASIPRWPIFQGFGSKHCLDDAPFTLWDGDMHDFREPTGVEREWIVTQHHAKNVHCVWPFIFIETDNIPTNATLTIGCAYAVFRKTVDVFVEDEFNVIPGHPNPAGSVVNYHKNSMAPLTESPLTKWDWPSVEQLEAVLHEVRQHCGVKSITFLLGGKFFVELDTDNGREYPNHSLPIRIADRGMNYHHCPLSFWKFLDIQLSEKRSPEEDIEMGWRLYRFCDERKLKVMGPGFPIELFKFNNPLVRTDDCWTSTAGVKIKHATDGKERITVHLPADVKIEHATSGKKIVEVHLPRSLEASAQSWRIGTVVESYADREIGLVQPEFDEGGEFRNAAPVGTHIPSRLLTWPNIVAGRPFVVGGLNHGNQNVFARGLHLNIDSTVPKETRIKIGPEEMAKVKWIFQVLGPMREAMTEGACGAAIVEDDAGFAGVAGFYECGVKGWVVASGLDQIVRDGWVVCKDPGVEGSVGNDRVGVGYDGHDDGVEGGSGSTGDPAGERSVKNSNYVPDPGVGAAGPSEKKREKKSSRNHAEWDRKGG